MLQLGDCDHLTLLLYETKYISNRTELPLMARIAMDRVIKNFFLDLLQLRCCNTSTIFKTVENFLENKSISIKKYVFLGWMDGSMSDNHNRIKQFFQDATPHFTLIYCSNYHIALSFTHLIPQCDDFQNLDTLLLKLHLLMKNSRV